MAQLKEADVVFLLVSPDFISSDYCYKRELQMALERHESGRSVVVPIVIRPTDFHGAPFSKLLMLPFDARPVSSWSNIDEAWLSVASGVRRLIDQIPAEQPKSQVLRTKRINSCLVDVFDQLQARYVDPDVYRAPRFGFSLEDLDEIVGGVWPGEWLILASRPEHGHVELGHALVLDAAVKGKLKVLVISQRLTANQFTNRLICNLGRLSRLRFSRGELEDEDWSRAAAAIRMLKDADITIDDEPIRTASALRERLNEIECDGFNVILFDGLEYVSSESEERAVSLAISDFSKTSRAAVVGTLSLGAEMEHRSYRKPMLSDFNEWRVLEKFASKIILCAREQADWGAAADELSGNCTLFLVKSPEGVSASVQVRYFHEYGVVNGIPKLAEKQSHRSPDNGPKE